MGYLQYLRERGSASFEEFMQAGMQVEFRRGPQYGIVQLGWDGDEITLDLYSPEPGIYIQALFPELNWQKADVTRKVWLAAAFVSDFLGISVLVTVISLLIYHLFFSAENKNQATWSGHFMLCTDCWAAICHLEIK